MNPLLLSLVFIGLFSIWRSRMEYRLIEQLYKKKKDPFEWKKYQNEHAWFCFTLVFLFLFSLEVNVILAIILAYGLTELYKALQDYGYFIDMMVHEKSSWVDCIKYMSEWTDEFIEIKNFKFPTWYLWCVLRFTFSFIVFLACDYFI